MASGLGAGSTFGARHIWRLIGRAGLFVLGAACILGAAVMGGVTGYWFVAGPALAGWIAFMASCRSGRRRNSGRRRKRLPGATAAALEAAAIAVGGAAAAGAIQPILSLAPDLRGPEAAVLTMVLVAAAYVVALGAGAKSIAPLAFAAPKAPEARLSRWFASGRRRILPVSVVGISALATWWHLGLNTGLGRGYGVFPFSPQWGDLSPVLGLFLGLALSKEQSRSLISGSLLGVALTTGGVALLGTSDAAVSFASRWQETTPAVWTGAAAVGLAGLAAFRVVSAFSKTPSRQDRWRPWPAILPVLIVLTVTTAAVALLTVWLPLKTAVAAGLALFAGAWVGRFLGRRIGFAVWPATTLGLSLGVAGLVVAALLVRWLDATLLTSAISSGSQGRGFPLLAAVVAAGLVSSATVALSLSVCPMNEGPVNTVPVDGAGPVAWARAFRHLVWGATGFVLLLVGAAGVLIALDGWSSLAGHPWGTTPAGGPDRAAFLARSWEDLNRWPVSLEFGSAVISGPGLAAAMLMTGAVVGLAAFCLPRGSGLFVLTGLLFWPTGAVWILAGFWIRSQLARRGRRKNTVWRFAGALLAGFGLGALLAGITAVALPASAIGAALGDSGWPWVAVDVVFGAGLALFLRELAGRCPIAANTSSGGRAV